MISKTNIAKFFLAGSTLLMSSTAMASGPDILSGLPIFRSETPAKPFDKATVDDSFRVTFNGRAGVMLGYHTGNLSGGPASAGSILNYGVSGIHPNGIITAGPAEEDYWSISTNYTRFGFKAEGDSALGAFAARIEGDFNGAGNTFRLRHGYGQVGMILAGQTNSLWSEAHPYISNWDWNGDPLSPGNNITRRQQLRLSLEPVPGMKAAVAIEDPSSTVDPDFFDITANVQLSVGPADLVVSGILGFDDDSTALADEDGWAVSASATFDMGPLMLTALGVYSDEQNLAWHSTHPFTVPAITGTDIDSWGAGGSIAGPLSDTLSWHAGGSYSSKKEGATVDFDLIYATASLEWSPMPQYSVIGQAVYEKAEDHVANQEDDAWSFLNYWMYKF
jgi:predicted porin